LNKGSKKWIAISIAVALVLAFIVGLVVLRQTHAIWTMTSSNACTINATLNTVFTMNPIVEVIVLVAIIFIAGYYLTGCVGKGFE